MLAQPTPELLRDAQAGDERAFATIVRTYEALVFNFVLRLVGDRSLAEDLTQETFIRVYFSLPGFSRRSSFTTWLFQVAKNRALDELRTASRDRRRAVQIEEIARPEAETPPAEVGEAIEAIWRAVEALTDDLRTALLLRDLVGLSYAEIAETLEVTLATVKWRIHRARADVQAALAREGISVGGRGAGKPPAAEAV